MMSKVPQYLFDTNILLALIKQPSSYLAQKISALAETDFCTSVIVACELRYGAQKKDSPELNKKVNLLLANINVIALTSDIDKFYAEIRVALEKNGEPIGANDMLIAAHAIALDMILITDNEREFRRIPSLKVENWLRPR